MKLILAEAKCAWLYLAVCVFASFAFAAEAFAVNPITDEGKFLSDPAGRVGPDGRLWVFGSRDERPDAYCSKWNDALSTGDLRSWAFHPGIFEASRIPGEDTVMYAPDALFANGKWHLFYCTPSRHMEGVATADSAAGPYGDARPYAFANQIDPSVFRDDDGTVYYTWGQFSCKCAVLRPDLSGVVPGSVRDGVITEAKHNFHEGSQLFKRNGVYYLAYADIGRSHAPEGDAFTGKPMDWGRRRPTCIGYSTAPTPFGPYTYRGVIIDNAGCDPENWNNHGAVVEFKGRWYVLYHRTTNGSRSMRKTCIEPIEFDANGLIREAEMTSNGAGDPLDPFARTEARLACGLTGHARIVTLPGGQERIGEIRSGDTATWRYFDFPRAATAIEIEAVPAAGGRVVVSDGRGLNYAEGEIPSGDGVTPRTTTVPIRMPLTTGRQAVRIAFFTANGGTFGSLESITFK